MPKRINKNKRATQHGDNTSMISLLKKIQLNTATPLAQVIPDTVVFPTLKRDRPYSCILAFETFFTSATGTPSTYTQAIALNMLNGYADYISAFDKYRIMEVEAEFIPNNQSTPTTGSGILSTVIDYDDNTNLVPGQQYEYDSCFSVGTAASFKRTFIPRSAGVLYVGVAPTGYSENKASQWIDCATPGVTHYGLKAVVAPTTPAYAAQIVYRVHVQFSRQH